MSHPPSRLDPRSTACTPRTMYLGIHHTDETKSLKKNKPDETVLTGIFGTHVPTQQSKKNYLAPSQIHMNQKFLCSSQSCPPMPNYVHNGFSDDGPPLEEEEDVLFPYWETREHDLFEEEAVLREFVRIHERQERSLWDYLGPE